MQQVVNKKVRMSLVGLDGNVFFLMGAFAQNAECQGWSQKEIEAVLGECQSGNYTHAVATLLAHTTTMGLKDDDDDDDDDD